jgi:ATP-dependent 26S proteasome regulatory subunit
MFAIREKRDAITQTDILGAVKRVNSKRSKGGISATPEALYG